MAAAAHFAAGKSADVGAMFAAVVFAAARYNSASHLALATRVSAFSVCHHVTIVPVAEQGATAMPRHLALDTNLRLSNS
jgi:hypothetical protein